MYTPHVSRTVPKSGKRMILRIVTTIALVFVMIPASMLAPSVAAATPEVDCGAVMQSVADIADIERCKTSPTYPSWMTDNADKLGQRPLSQVVIPGAHDALTGLYEENAPGAQWMVQTQDLNLWGLLQAGVRTFDLRFCTPDDKPSEFYACHGGFYADKVTPESVISDLESFTNAHPQEILIVGWRWENPTGNDATRKQICSNFFETFRNILVPTTVDGTATLEEIWSLPNQPRIIMHTEDIPGQVNTKACDSYYADNLNYHNGPSDRNLDWASSFYGGHWANSPFGDRDASVTGVCGLHVDVDAIIDHLPDLIPVELKNVVRLALEKLYSDDYCTDVATANTLDLTSNRDPTKLNNTQAVLTPTDIPQIAYGVYALTAGTEAISSEWPAIENNLLNLWKSNTSGARRRFNIILGDFVEHSGLVPLTIKLNTGPLIDQDLFFSNDGTPYVPGAGNWSNGLTLKISCEEEVFGELVKSFPIDGVTVSGVGDNTTLSGTGPWEIDLTAPVENGALTLTCSDTSGKIARTTITGLYINGAPTVNAGPDREIDEGDALKLSTTFTDEPASDTHVASINWDDGTTESGIVTEPDGASVGTVAGSHVYVDDGSHTITVCVTDSFDIEGCDSLELTVNNVPPVITGIVTNEPVSQGDPAVITVSATDPAGVNDPLTYAFDCDNDSSYETPGDGNIGTCTLDPSAATSTIGVQVSDDDGGVTTASAEVSQNVTVCSNAYTGAFSSAGALACPPGTNLLVLPGPQPTTLCINGYTGSISWSPNGCPVRGSRAHVVPEDGPLYFCQSSWTGSLRAFVGLQQCNANETPGVIPG